MRRLILPAAVILAPLAILVTLGNWQVDRLAWKNDLIERVAQRPTLAPLSADNELLAAAHDDSFLEGYEYRRARLAGHYDPAGEVRVFTSLSGAKGPFSGPGYWVLTPLLSAPTGQPVYVNRGFVPEDRKGAYAPPPSGDLTVEGLVRGPERGSWFTPDPNPQARLFFARDPHRIAAATGLEREPAGFFLDLLPEAGGPELPQAGETRMNFTNNHLAYAVTWYGLAAALLAVFASYLWSRRREGSQGPRLTQPGQHP